MPIPSSTTAGRVFNDLRKAAKAQGRTTDELLIFYVLERFLYRLASSPDSDRFVLKGGLLLAIYDARRPTRDGDLLAQMNSDAAEVLGRVQAIADLPADDGVVFSTADARATPIREGDLYEGVRIVIPATVATARVKLSLDVNFGDPVTPGAVLTEYPQLLSDSGFAIRTYPIETVLAEKLSTAVSLGELNTRERDYADIWRLTGLHELDGTTVHEALLRTSSHRSVALRHLSEAAGRLGEIRAAAYTAWLRRQGTDAGLYPSSYSEVVQAVVDFADPIIEGSAAGGKWSPDPRGWRSQ